MNDGGELDTMWLPAGGGRVDAALGGGLLETDGIALGCGVSSEDSAGNGFAGTATVAGGALAAPLARAGAFGRMLATHC